MRMSEDKDQLELRGSQPKHQTQAHEKGQNKWQVYDILYLISGIVGIIAPFLPFAQVSAFGFSESTSLVVANGNIGDGIFYIILFIIGLVLFFFKKKLGMLIVAVLTTLLGVLTFGFYIYYMNQIGQASSFFNLQIGGYLLLLSIIVFLVSAFLSYKNRV